MNIMNRCSFPSLLNLYLIGYTVYYCCQLSFSYGLYLALASSKVRFSKIIRRLSTWLGTLRSAAQRVALISMVDVGLLNPMIVRKDTGTF